MVRNFFLIALRNILKQKISTFINVTGLAIGLTASLLIFLWVQNELDYDRFNRNAENIYRVEEDQFYSGERYHVTVTPFPSGPVWKEKIPEIREQTRLNRLSRILFRQGNNVFFEQYVVAADSGLFNVFTMPLLLGDPGTALKAPHSLVLNEKLARKYFGDSDPLGKTITLENKSEFIVTGVMKNLPGNSILYFDAIVPFASQEELGTEVSSSWGNNSIFTYVLLGSGTDIASVNKKLTDVVLEANPETTTKFMVFPLTDIHLKGQFGYTETHGPVIAVMIFTLIAIFILLIACINFINLSTAKASMRMKEIGVKKVAGADRKILIIQFMLESFMLVTVALVLALLLTGLFLKGFNTLSGKNFVFSDLIKWKFIITFLITGLFAALVSGIYPALYLSSFKPVSVLKGEPVTGGNGRLRKTLVVIQFTLSILIATTAVFMMRQFRYLQNKELGFDRHNLICIPMAESMKSKYYTLKKELQNETLIKGVTASMNNPVRLGSNSGGASWEGKDPEKQVLIGTNTIDYDYIKTMQMELVSGRDFSLDFSGDIARDTTGNFLVNEEVVKVMGSGDPVGKNFNFMGIKGTIVGVLKNFHYLGADQLIQPMAFALTEPEYLNFILVRLAPGKAPESLKALEKIWQKIIPEYPLEYTFIDQDYENLYRSQIRLAGILKYFTILAIIIACLGLYGLSSYAVQRRTNEIGIRKVMGAAPSTIIFTISREFISLVLVSLILALPSGWYLIHKLLEQFPYRINIEFLVFAAIAAIAIMIAFLTVCFQSYRASVINPAVALKIE